MLIQDFVLVLVQVILITTFITVFYFTYVCKLEETLIIEHIRELVHTLTDDFSVALDDRQKSRIKASLEKTEPENMDSADKEVELRNQSLLSLTVVLMTTIFVIGIGVSLILIKVYDLNWVLILRNSLVITGIVALTEFVFITYLAFNYKTLDPNIVKIAIVESVYTNLYNPPTDTTQP